MKTRKVWKILLGVVGAIVVLGAIGFGFHSMRMWGGRFSAVGTMPHGYDTDMQCEEAGEAVCEENMLYGVFPMRGTTGMPHMRSMPGMYGSWRRTGFSPLTGLLLLILIVIAVLHIGRWHRFHKFYHYGSMHMHPGSQFHSGDACCPGEKPEHPNANHDGVEDQTDTK